LELGLDFSTNEITLLLLVQSFVIVVLHELKILLQLLLLSLLLVYPSLGPLNLKVDLLFLSQSADLKMTTFATSEQVDRHVLKQGIDLRDMLDSVFVAELIAGRQVVTFEDLVLACRHSCNGDYQPVFVREVLLDEINAGGDVQLFKIADEFLHQYKFARRFDAHSEDDLVLVYGKDLTLLNEQQLLFRDILVVLLGEVLSVPGLQLPVGCDALQCC